MTAITSRVKFDDQQPEDDPNHDHEINPNYYLDNQNYDSNYNQDSEQEYNDQDIGETYNVSGVEPRKTEKYEYHFQTKIKNSGFWGKVRLRNGTWLLIAGIILFCISVIFIGVFWGFWYSHKLNYPMRILAITFLSLGITFFISGLISNYVMELDSSYKIILGSPFHKATYLMFVSMLFLVVASDLITLYYTYWHNRWVNTPLIIIAIILYFFGGIGLIASIHHICKRFRNPDYEQVKKEKIKVKQLQQLDESEPENEEVINDELNVYSVGDYNNSELYSDNSKRDFRKKMLKLTPRLVVATSNDVETNQYDQV